MPSLEDTFCFTVRACVYGVSWSLSNYACFFVNLADVVLHHADYDGGIADVLLGEHREHVDERLAVAVQILQAGQILLADPPLIVAVVLKELLHSGARQLLGCSLILDDDQVFWLSTQFAVASVRCK